MFDRAKPQSKAKIPEPEMGKPWKWIQLAPMRMVLDAL